MLGSTGSLANSLNDSGECKEKCKSSWGLLVTSMERGTGILF